MRRIYLWPEAAIVAGDTITASVTIELPDKSRRCLWYRLPIECSSLLASSCDPFTVAAIFLAMQQKASLVVNGEVSPSLLRNLEEFQAVWHCWHPQRYQKIDIIAEGEKEQTKASSNKAIAAFSGGIDSCFTLWQHQTQRCGRQCYAIDAGLMVHGFDIPLGQAEIFTQAAAKSQTMLASLGAKLIPLATNFRELPLLWEDVFGAAAASCLMLLQPGYTAGLIGSSAVYSALLLPYGSNPISDRLLSSSSFEIVHDAAGFSRLDKIKEIAQWPAAMQNLRVCWQGDKKDRNCGKCEKCARTILGFRLYNLPLPPCFEQDITNAQILALRGIHEDQLTELDPILAAAKTAGIKASWVKALEKCIWRNRQIGKLIKIKAAARKRSPDALLRMWQQFRRK